MTTLRAVVERALKASITIAVITAVLFSAYSIGVSAEAVRCAELVQEVRADRDRAVREAAVDRDDALARLVNLRGVNNAKSKEAVDDFNQAHNELEETRKQNPVTDPDRICD